MNDRYCGHVAEPSALADLGAVCCIRPARDDGRCVWHADAETKPAADLLASRPVPGERLDDLVLHGATLPDADWFAGCVLVRARFTDVTLHDADFSGADLRRARFERAELVGARFDGADLEDTAFRAADLRGASFRDARLYRVGFRDARINRETAFGDRLVYESLVAGADSREAVLARAEEATWTYATVQRLYEENAHHGHSLAYYTREMDLRRRVAWRTREYGDALKLEGSRFVTAYGSSPTRVIAASAALILLCALLYPVTGGVQEIGLNRTITYEITDPSGASPARLLSVFLQSLYFSVVTFATLGYGDIQPVGPWARTIAGLEALAGPLMMALLVFVLTRRMRWITGTR